MLVSLVLQVLILLASRSKPKHWTHALSNPGRGSSIMFESVGSIQDKLLGSIQYKSVGLANLEMLGCSECFAMRHSEGEEQLLDKILACSGPYLFVGVRQEGTDIFHIGAFGNATEVTRVTSHNLPNLSNGVYWYLTPGYSFGFLNSTDLQQAPIDAGTTGSEFRMSWSLSPTDRQEGYRVGSLVLNGSKSSLQKFSRTIFNCPKSEYTLLPRQSSEVARSDMSIGTKVDTFATSSNQPDLREGRYQELHIHIIHFCCNIAYHVVNEKNIAFYE